MANKSKFFRIATEGDTTDGRVIQRSWLEQAGKNFNRAKYGARIWLEHLRSLLPDSPFKAYGDVLAVKTEEVDVDGQKKLALFAQIDATPELVAMNKARQKIYTSCELDPNFAKSGEAYLVGLAVTDSPASLGTEMLTFASKAVVNPLAERKLSPDNLFTAAQEAAIEFEDEPSASAGDSLFTKIKELLSFGKKDADDRFADIGQAVETVALSQKNLLDKFAALEKANLVFADSTKATADDLEASRKDYAALLEKLGHTSDGSQKRPPAKGGESSVTTDC